MNREELLNGIICTGCGGCGAVCPRSAIRLQMDEEGFHFPSVDEVKCINCGKCVKSCPARERKTVRNINKGYAAYCKDYGIYQKSTSGGIFGQIAYHFIEKGWYVCGAAFNDDLRVEHIVINDLNDLQKIQGSKYVQSNTDGVYNKIKKLLADGNKVLFSGTPCQLDALYSLIDNKFSGQLLTIEIICHGVSSPLFLKKDIEKEYKSGDKNIELIEFRMKDEYERTGFNFKIRYEDGSETLVPYYRDLYYTLYLRGESFRKSCYECRYANPQRVGDITIGDCNSYKKYQYLSIDKVISIVLINSELGAKVWEDCKHYFEFVEADVEAEVSSNAQLSHPVVAPVVRKNVFNDILGMDYKEVKKKYMKADPKKIIAFHIKRIIKLSTRKKIVRVLRGRKNEG